MKEGRYEPQQGLSQLDEKSRRPSTLIKGILVIEIAWGAMGLIGFGGLLVTGPGGGPTFFGGLLMHFSFGILWMGVALALRILQNRRIPALLGDPSKTWRDMWAVIRWAGGIGLALQLWSVLPFLGDVAYSRPLALWLMFLPISLVAIFIQTTAEELYFRGFIQSTLAARFRSPFIWMVLPSVAFGLIHVTNGNGPTEITQIVLYTGLFGLCCADLTARSGSLGAAIGLHFSHNAVLALIYGFEGSWDSGLALWLFPNFNNGAPIDGPVISFDLIVWLLILLIYWLAARNALRR